jgi:hypothetical protein
VSTKTGKHQSVTVGLAFIGEVLAGKRFVRTLRLVDARDVRLDPFAFHQPTESLRRTEGGVGDQLLGIDTEPPSRSADHIHRRT